jgi:hypothetical protein
MVWGGRSVSLIDLLSPDESAGGGNGSKSATIGSQQLASNSGSLTVQTRPVSGEEDLFAHGSPICSVSQQFWTSTATAANLDTVTL